MAGSVAPNTIIDGLVVYLDAANSLSYPGSGTTWLNISKVKTNASLINGPTYSTSNGGTIIFDGTNDYIGQNYSLTGLTDFTIEIWARNDYQRHPTTNNDSLALGGIVAAGGSYLRYGVTATGATSPGYVIFYAAGPNTSATYSFPAGFTINGWHCYTFTRSTTFQRIYIDGQQVASSTFSNQTALNIDYNGIGRYAYTYWNGAISNCKIYTKSFSADEVFQNFGSLRGRYRI